MSPTEPENVSITNEDVKHLLNICDSMTAKGITIGKASLFKPTEVFCTKDGVVLQLWVDTLSQEMREWRPLPSFEKASIQYNCVRVS